MVMYWPCLNAKADAAVSGTSNAIETQSAVSCLTSLTGSVSNLYIF